MLTINAERFIQLFNEQAQIGATPEGGLSRPALSEADMRVRQWFQTTAEAHGLIYNIDGAANQTATLLSANPAAKTLLIGSHLDSVPNGGRFDGALGVIAALEVALSLKDAQYSLPFHLQVINFTDEEGTHQGLFGSSALIGALKAETFHAPRGGRDLLTAGMVRAGISEASVLAAQRNPQDLLGYLEVHIEQGTRLEESQQALGIVTSIVGIRSYWLNFKGEAAHAGTQPLSKRRDALWGASAFIQAARDLIMANYFPGVVNFGRIFLKPDAFNIVPAEVELALEFRHGDLAPFNAMEEALLNLAKQVAKTYQLELRLTPVNSVHPTAMSAHFVEALESAANQLGLSHSRLLSFAGHDAQSLATITDSVMFFIPSVQGISHNPKEYSTPEDCLNAANVLLQAVLNLAEQQN